MSIFGWFSSPSTGKKVSFASGGKLHRQDIVDLVWNIKSLTMAQKNFIKNELFKQLDDGGVSLFEYKEFLRRLKLRRIELGLSEIDIAKLEEVMGK